jgi:hypothetical protein
MKKIVEKTNSQTNEKVNDVIYLRTKILFVSAKVRSR